MSRGIVVGVTWWLLGEKSERVEVGTDIRRTIDKLVKSAPDWHKRDVARFLAPLLEGREPKSPGFYDIGFIVWWKRCDIEVSS